MLRMIVLALAIGAPGMAMADPFPQAATGAEVRGDDGTVVGHVTHVERDAHGRIVSAAIPGLEPADAPRAVVVAQNDERDHVSVLFRRTDRERPTQQTSGRLDRAR